MSESRKDSVPRGIIESGESGSGPSVDAATAAELQYDQPFECGCGAVLLAEEWRGRAIVRCGECGQRWRVEVKSLDEGRGYEFSTTLISGRDE